MQLGGMTWTDVGDGPILVVPVGSCEQHGPHLPLHTDTMVAGALADDLASRRDDCIVGPPLTVTASGEHQGFPGTLSIGSDVMADVIIELARSADWAAGIVFVNGHGGNASAMDRAAGVLGHERRNVLVWWPRVDGGDLHAGHTETSLMLHLAPDQVRRDAAVAGPIPERADLVAHGVRPLSDTGVLGDPAGATAEHGRAIFEQLTSQLADEVSAWRRRQ